MSQQQQGRVRYTCRKEGETIYVRMTGSTDFLRIVEGNLDHYAKRVLEDYEERADDWLAHAGSVLWESPTVMSYRITRRPRLSMREISGLFSNQK